MSCFRLGALAAVLALFPSQAHALAKFTVVTTGTGFSDPTPARAVGGNLGATLGEQRKLALERALDIWGKRLDSSVPIVVQASFKNLGCAGGGGVLAQANSNRLFADPSSPSKFWYPGPLAERMAGRDLAPGTPDLHIEFNAAIDTSCKNRFGAWYYGFDGAEKDRPDLITTALHELAHGLGFSSWVDPRSGVLDIPGEVDVFTSHVFDLDLGKSWAELTESQRALSATNVRHVVWDGAEAQLATQDFLTPGAATLTLEPVLSGFQGWVGDAAGALNPALHPARGRVVLAAPLSGCSALGNAVKDAVVLLEPDGSCTWSNAARNAASAGAVGALFIVSSYADQPAEPLAATGETVALPVATLSATDAELLATEVTRGRPIVALLGGSSGHLLGADARGRPLLFSPSPIQVGSSISHFDSLARPDLILEPYDHGVAQHEVDPVTLAVLHDMGWTTSCGDGRLDADEQCDEGADNADHANSGCRTDCQLPGCGDGVLDANEACDDGKINDDARPDACRSSCRPAHCGDGVRDHGEACDEGDSGLAKGTCRSDCTEARCGDGTVDPDEVCDDGQANDDTKANACRTTCEWGRCGDGVLDVGETCDEGSANSDLRPDACRSMCTHPRCGDGVLDRGEVCDGVSDCASECGRMAASAVDAKAPGIEPLDDAAPTYPTVRRRHSGCAVRPDSLRFPPWSGGLCALALSGFRWRRRVRNPPSHFV